MVVILRENFVRKMSIETGKQLQQQAVLARTTATNDVGLVEETVEKALKTIEEKSVHSRRSWPRMVSMRIIILMHLY